MFLLDTDTLVAFFRGRGRVAERLLAVPPSAVAIPAVAVAEVEWGIARSAEPGPRAAHWQALLAAVQVLPLGAEEAASAARVQALLQKQGTPLAPLDALVAGTALARQAVLVTRSTRVFSVVPGLALEDWYPDGPQARP